MPEKSPSRPPFLPSIRRLLQLAGRHKSWLFLALITDLTQAVLIVLSNHVIRGLFDSVTAGDQPTFINKIILTLIIGLIGIPLAFLRTRSAGLFSERTLFELRQKVAAHLNFLPFHDLEGRHSGDFLSVVNADLAKVKSLTASDLLDFLGQISRGLFALIYITLISWQLMLISLILTPLLFMFLAKLSEPISKRTQEMQEIIGKVNSVAQDTFEGLPITKSFNLTRVMDERFNQVNQRVIRKGRTIARMRSLVDVISSVVGFTPFLITFGIGGYLAVTGKMTFGSIFAFINLLNFVVSPLGNIPRLVANLSESIGAAQRIFQILDTDLERSTGSVTQPALTTGPIIRFKDLSFAYAAQAPTLSKISFEIHPGEKIAVVGPSGSGKSTLLKLLLGFYPVEDGQIFLFGEDLNHWKLPDARQQMAFVAQDTYLFPVSIEENIACGKLGAGKAEIERAASAANMHDFIQTLDQGYQTSVGERGARLSGGQRQRLSLSRAILKNAPILLLDEPTSALDTESEALVQEALDRFMVNRTSVVVAHRLSTIKNADRVLVLDKGVVVEQGTHEELLARGGLYQELYEKQFGLEQAGS